MYQTLKLRSVVLISVFLLLMVVTLGASADRLVGLFSLIVAIFLPVAIFLFAVEVLCWIIPPLKAFVPWRHLYASD